MSQETKTENPYRADEIPAEPRTPGKKKPAWRTALVGVFIFLFGSFNALLSLFNNAERGLAFALGGAIGSAVILPLIVAGLFAISRRYRNLHKFLKAIMWTQIIFSIVTLVNLSQKISQASGQ